MAFNDSNLSVCKPPTSTVDHWFCSLFITSHQPLWYVEIARVTMYPDEGERYSDSLLFIVLRWSQAQWHFKHFISP